MTGRRIAYVGIGVSCLLILAALSLPAHRFPWNLAVLGGGVLGLSSALVFLQLSYWREGESRPRSVAQEGVPPVPPLAPAELRNPRLRRVWEGMEASRLLMTAKEQEVGELERRREGERLGLPPEEEILFMEEPSWLSWWPVAMVSAALIFLSVLISNPTASFLCLGLGLCGLLSVHRWRGRFRYYLTTFRILVRERPVLSRKGRVRWISLPYRNIREVRLDRGLVSRTLRLEAHEQSLDIRGLTPVRLFAAEAILREKLPALADKSISMPRPRL